MTERLRTLATARFMSQGHDLPPFMLQVHEMQRSGRNGSTVMNVAHRGVRQAARRSSLVPVSHPPPLAGRL